MATEVVELLRKHGVIPVIRLPRKDLALRAAEYLGAAGFRTFEITMSIPDAPAVIGRLSNDDGVLLGAGTVLSPEAARECLSAGARYVVSPGLVEGIAEECVAAGAACIMGALTPSEVLRALEMGADAVKIFPASSAGGPGHLRALKSIFPDVPLIPTGGVKLDNMVSYLESGAACVGIGSDLYDSRALEDGRRNEIAERARLYHAELARFRGEGNAPRR